MRKFVWAACLTGGLIAAAPQIATAQASIGVSYQPSLYWALPFYIATEKGWWERARAEAEFFDLPRRRAASRSGAGEVLGRRRHGIGAGGARRRALRACHDRHHQ